MDEQDLRRSVEQARQQLNALRASVVASGIELASPEFASGLGSLEETLEKLQTHCAFLHDLLEEADVVFADYQDGRNTATTANVECLRSMSLASLVAEEDHRRSLARQLQDGLGQDIALAKMRLAALRDSTNADLQESLLGIERLVEKADRSFRSVTFQLSPLVLYDLGLVPAIEWLAEDVRDRFGIELRIADDGQVELPSETMRVIVFRVVRELVILAGRSGGTGQPVLLRHHSDEARLRVTIECGWSWLEASAADPAGDRVLSLSEQLGHVRATLHVDAQHGRGTTAIVTAALADGIVVNA